ncbi:MAG: hypothetical protein ACLU80_11095 [Dorea sp.]
MMKKYVKCLIMALTVITLSSTAVFAEERSTTETVQETAGLDLSQYKDGEVIPAEAIPDNHYPVINNQEGRSVATSTYTYALKAADSKKCINVLIFGIKIQILSMYLKLTKATEKSGGSKDMDVETMGYLLLVEVLIYPKDKVNM